jgi:hypothetical protein
VRINMHDLESSRFNQGWRHKILRYKSKGEGQGERGT